MDITLIRLNLLQKRTSYLQMVPNRLKTSHRKVENGGIRTENGERKNQVVVVQVALLQHLMRLKEQI